MHHLLAHRSSEVEILQDPALEGHHIIGIVEKQDGMGLKQDLGFVLVEPPLDRSLDNVLQASLSKGEHLSDNLAQFEDFPLAHLVAAMEHFDGLLDHPGGARQKVGRALKQRESFGGAQVQILRKQGELLFEDDGEFQMEHIRTSLNKGFQLALNRIPFT